MPSSPAPSTPTPRHVAIIGSGIIGAACAVEAQRAGFSVTLIDPNPPGSREATSFGNAGWLSSQSIIPPAGPGVWKQVPGYLLDPLGPLTLRWRYLPRTLPWLLRYVQSGSTAERVARIAHALRPLLQDAPALHRQLSAEAGVEHLIEQRGLLHVYTSRAAFDADALGWQIRKEEGIAFNLLNSDALRAREPDLAPQYQFGVEVTEAGHCRNPGAYTAALATHALGQGAQWLKARATGIRIEHCRVKAVRTDHGDVPCDAAVIATGAWSAKLAQSAGDKVSLDTERGYHVMLDVQAPPGPRTPMMVMDRKLIVHQMEHGLRVAGQVEIAGLDAEPDWRRADVLREHVFQIFPSLPRSALEQSAVSWMGRRPSTPDGLPCIGRALGCANVIHAYGHGHIGLGSSARTARLVAQLLSHEQPEIDIAPFSPQRWQR